MSRFACLVLTLSACGGSDGTPGSSGGPLTLAVGQVSQPYAIGGVQPSSGRRFVEVSATISNGSSGVESIAFALFAVRTASGLQIQASAATAQLAQSCGADQSLAPGGLTMCSLAFEVPTSEIANALVWLDPKTMQTSTASLPMVTAPSLVAACEQIGMFKNGSQPACTSCTMGCVPANLSACSGAQSTCAESCLRTNSDRGAACNCLEQCLTSDSCREAIGSNYQCELDTCGSVCN